MVSMLVVSACSADNGPSEDARVFADATIRASDATTLIDSGPASDAAHSSADASTVDAGSRRDAAIADAGMRPDATVTDAGGHLDATVADTGRHPDATVADTGRHPDAASADTGLHPDAAVADTGLHPDASSGRDAGASCPPAGPYGVNVGDFIPDIALPDCDGNMHRLHDLCLTRAAWMFIFAGW